MVTSETLPNGIAVATKIDADGLQREAYLPAMPWKIEHRPRGDRGDKLPWIVFANGDDVDRVATGEECLIWVYVQYLRAELEKLKAAASSSQSQPQAAPSKKR